MWPFEHIGPNGQTYLHNDNWEKFVKERDAEYPHDWRHRRAIITLCMPHDSLEEIPGVNEQTAIITVDEDFSAIFQPYPCWLRTGIDPDAKLPSFNLFIEDGHVTNERITLFSTGGSFFPNALMFGLGRAERFAFFRDKYWRVWTVKGGGIGSKPPMPPPVEQKKPSLRSLDDDWT